MIDGDHAMDPRGLRRASPRCVVLVRVFHAGNRRAGYVAPMPRISRSARTAFVSFVVVGAVLTALLVGPPGAGAEDPGTARPYPKATGDCYHGAGPTGMAPNQLAAAYGLEPLWAEGHKGQGKSIAVVDPGEIPNEADVADFRHCFGVTTPLTVTKVGTGAEPSVTGEATLDVTVALTAAPGLEHVYQFAGRDGLENPLLELVKAALDPANTGGKQVDAISTSFGICESRLTGEVPPTGSSSNYDAAYREEMNAVLAEAASKGVTLFADAGDSGSTNCAHHPVTDTDPYRDLPNVSFPGTSPYAVSVGGTQLEREHEADGSGRITTERVWNEPDTGTDPRMAGGGGVSTLESRPAWQDGFASTSMRSVPDITMLAGSPGYSWSGDKSEWFGTSAATPYSAAAWLVVLSALESKGIPSPGFAGPVFYELARTDYAAVYRDITVGGNAVWDEEAVGCCHAKAGYDEASGLGSLRWDAVVTALEAKHHASTSTTSTTAADTIAVATTPRYTG